MANRTTATGIATSGAFKGLKTPRDILRYNLMRGVTDFSNLEQWDFYEKGYPFLVVIKAPDFMMDLAEKDDDIKNIVYNYIHVLENDFRGIDNIENITGESNGEITNGIRSIQLINKVTQTGTTQFNMQFFERSGSIMTKFHELYLTGIKDKDTQVKTYHGLIDEYVFGQGSGGSLGSGKDPGPHRECFTFMYFITDNTMTKIERAFLICAAQPTSAPFSDLYDGDKGDIGFVPLNLQFNGFFINNDYVYQKAEKMLLAMRNPANVTGSRIIVDSNNFKYKGIAEVKIGNDTDFETSPVWNNNGQVTDSTVGVDGNTGSATNKWTAHKSNSGGNDTDGNPYNESSFDYLDTVKNMSNGEHYINSSKNASAISAAANASMNSMATGVLTNYAQNAAGQNV